MSQPNYTPTAEEIARRYPTARRSGDGWLIPCPCHEDDQPSLSICDTDKGILVHCFAGCDWQDVKKKLGIWRNGGAYDKNAFLVAVYQHPDGRTRPRYREDHDGECWRRDCKKTGPHKHIWGEKGRSSTGCHLLTWGKDSLDKVLVLVEGEKSAKALLAHVGGELFTPVTWNGGASVKRSIFDIVDGRDVILWPDADAAGKRAMSNAGRAAVDTGALSVSIVDVEGLPEKADAADVDAAAALDLLAAAQPYDPPAAKQSTYAAETDWPIVTERGAPARYAIDNVLFAISKLDHLQLSFDEFSRKAYCNGAEIDDAAAVAIQVSIERLLKFSPSKEALHAGIQHACRDNPFHPIRDYLNSLTWDGKLRLPTFGRYFGLDKTDALGNATARLIPYGQVARILQPGAKFDYCVVLQGAQGVGKSTALKILAGGDTYFLDSFPLDGFDLRKTVVERTRGKWIVELGELAGMRFADQDKLKQLVTGTADVAREAYERLTAEILRQFVFTASTNAVQFLRDTTGARRFPVVHCRPVAGRTIALEDLRRDRDQILAEAVRDVREMLPADITLPERLFDEAEADSEQHRTIGGFEEWLRDWIENSPGRDQQFKADALRKDMRLDLSSTPIYPSNNEFSQVVAATGYKLTRRRIEGRRVAVYVRSN